MDLLEREAPRAVIQTALDQARQGHGIIVLVSGEAGVGKTAFVTDFTAPYRTTGSVLWGACDPLFTPRPLGPLYDIALQKYPHLLDLLNSGVNWLTVASSLLKALLVHPSPSLLVFEDMHWADEATLDLIKYLGRRIEKTHTLLILTYRDDETSSLHLLREALGHLPPGQTIRLALTPLSEAAVAALAGRANRSSKGLFQVTKGNPFFVTEVLRSDDERLPETVRDAVLTRAAHLPLAARDVLEVVSIIPGQAQLWLLESVLQPSNAAIDACIEGGFLIPSASSLSFRHELARLAISESLTYSRAQALNQKILAALVEQKSSVPLALLVHHAVAAEDEIMVLDYAPHAAHEASQHGAHREAARLYQTALLYSHRLAADEHAHLLDGLSFEDYLTGQMDRAIRLREQAIRLWRQGGWNDHTGDDLRWLSRLHWFQGNKREADRFATEAVALLEQLPAGPELAMAYSNRSQLHMLAEETEDAIAWGDRALKIAETIHNDEIIIHALTNIGTAEMLSGAKGGLNKLEHALSLALAQEMHDHVARCYAIISSISILQRNYHLAGEYLGPGIAYTGERDMFSYHVYLRGWLARMRFDQGQWAEAAHEAREVLHLNPGSPVMSLPAVTTLGHILVRQGDPQAIPWLNQAREMALPTGELQRMGPVAAARAEAAWWEGDRQRVIEEASQVIELARRAGNLWQLGQAAAWIWRAGGNPGDLPDNLPAVYKAALAGDWRMEEGEWKRIDCPFERAMALSGGDHEAQLQALALYEALGARPAARALRHQMRSKGIKKIPRGPRPATRTNPEGLTSREMEILALLVDGANNAEIARHLSIAMKTVDHHVSKIFEKLDVHSRLEAAAAARQKKILPPAK